MKARIDLRVEIVDGPDTGYVLQESNRLVELKQETFGVRPYRVTVEFITPDLIRNWNIMNGEEES